MTSYFQLLGEKDSMISIARPLLSSEEEAAIHRVLASGQLAQGENVAAHHIAIIEDACQAHAAEIDGKRVGGFGTGCFSFYATKNITTGEGGMVTTNDPRIAEHVRLLRSHGQKEQSFLCQYPL